MARWAARRTVPLAPRLAHRGVLPSRTWTVLVLALPAACGVHTRSPVLLKGTHGVYEVPAADLTPPAADSKALSRRKTGHHLAFSVPLSETTLPTGSPTDGLNVHAYADKRYDLGAFALPAKRCLEGAVQQERQPSFFVYRKSGRVSTSTCYFTFDPEAVPLVLTPADYYVRTAKSESFQVAGSTIAPRGSCTLSFIRDGMLIEAWAVGALCTPDNYPQMRRSLDALFDRWRRK